MGDGSVTIHVKRRFERFLHGSEWEVNNINYYKSVSTRQNHIFCQQGKITSFAYDILPKKAQRTVMRVWCKKHELASEIRDDMTEDVLTLKGYSEIIAVTTPSIFIKSEIFAFW